ncbi:hypothetical protein C900_01602 [Fulvivirga imtechensis AK7]|uniref:Uncharacterized protein n=1 Tax=Fulvivirga imtechensis AK7 TaxID=1237149 RepID=L8JU71_9BACT|nr:hypothetical protein C900_01602 [Fulvivirga imtechensis AK7]
MDDDLTTHLSWFFSVITVNFKVDKDPAAPQDPFISLPQV